MTSALSRLATLASHFAPSSTSPTPADNSPTPQRPLHSHQPPHIHQLSPTFFLWRAAQIEPSAPCIYHTNSLGQIIQRSYLETADRARGLAYFLRKNGFKRVGILASNTPAFLESIYGVGAAGAVNVAINYRLKPEDLEYIFEHAEVDSILVDREFVGLLEGFQRKFPRVRLIVDEDTDGVEGEYDRVVREGWEEDERAGAQGWQGLETQVPDEDALIALAYT
ncbi:hypothetical protein KC352_g24095, partial [Hortaea werneckii]